jgi:hypothetical protein
LSENNFAKERRDWLAILLREILQNALDARLKGAPEVRVAIRLQPTSPSSRHVVDRLLPAEHVDRFRASVPHLSTVEVGPVQTSLIVEDFGTSGLTGRVDDPDGDGEGENWNAFWFREGEGGKEYSSGNGGAGQGKITYFSTSGLRTLFAYTVRSDDRRGCIFGASSFLREYTYGSRKWKRDSYWGDWQRQGESPLALPVFAAAPIERLRETFRLERRPDQTGLSLIIPSPRVFQEDEAVEITLAEFYVPIHRGDLVVEIGDTRIDRSTVAALADQRLSDRRARELHTCMTAGYRSFVREALSRSAQDKVVQIKAVAASADIAEESFESGDLAALREAFASDQPVSVRMPLRIRRKRSAPPEVESSLDVHLMQCVDLEQPEQAVIRKDLLIGEEPVGSGRLKQRVRGLTLITDQELSRLLLSAEEATHLRWNARLPRLGEYYRDGPVAVAIVRSAMARVLDVLTEADKQKDFKLLAKYFSAPGARSPRSAAGAKPKGGKPPIPPEGIPPPAPRLLRLEALPDGCLIRPSREGALSGARLPLTVRVQFAYEGLDRDAFAEYDPLDFNLQDKAFKVEGTGCTLMERQLNRVTVQVEKEPFALRVRGFDTNLRLRMRVTYEEARDAATVDAE